MEGLFSLAFGIQQQASGTCLSPALWPLQCATFMGGSKQIILSSALSLEENSKLKSKNAHCTQEMGQERSLWADTPGKLNLGGVLGRGRGLGEGQWEKTRE